MTWLAPTRNATVPNTKIAGKAFVYARAFPSRTRTAMPVRIATETNRMSRGSIPSAGMLSDREDQRESVGTESTMPVKTEARSTAPIHTVHQSSVVTNDLRRAMVQSFRGRRISRSISV